MVPPLQVTGIGEVSFKETVFSKGGLPVFVPFLRHTIPYVDSTSCRHFPSGQNVPLYSPFLFQGSEINGKNKKDALGTSFWKRSMRARGSLQAGVDLLGNGRIFPRSAVCLCF